MLVNPIQNTAIFDVRWLQVRPRISQKFGLNPQMYKQFNLKGHSGIDWGVPVGTSVFSPFDGRIRILNEGKNGYGLNVRIRSLDREIVLAHLSKVLVKDGEFVRVGDKIALSGNTGFSTGAHLHCGLRFLTLTGKKNIYDEPIRNHNNGYAGYIDFEPYIITWRGGYVKTEY